MQITAASSAALRRQLQRGACSNRGSVRERLTPERILEAIRHALGTPNAIAYVRGLTYREA